jgi:hypothetical protein
VPVLLAQERDVAVVPARRRELDPTVHVVRHVALHEHEPCPAVAEALLEVPPLRRRDAVEADHRRAEIDHGDDLFLAVVDGRERVEEIREVLAELERVHRRDLVFLAGLPRLGGDGLGHCVVLARDRGLVTAAATLGGRVLGPALFRLGLRRVGPLLLRGRAIDGEQQRRRTQELRELHDHFDAFSAFMRLMSRPSS